MENKELDQQVEKALEENKKWSYVAFRVAWNENCYMEDFKTWEEAKEFVNKNLKEYGKLRIYTQVYVHETGKWHAKKCYAFIWRKNK